MGSVLTRRAFPFACTAVMLLALLGCGGSAGAPATADAAGSIQYEALAVPDGVASDLWAALTAELERVLRETPPRAVSTPPAGEAGAAQLSFSEPDSSLEWLYRNTGDYNQDGLVGVADLTPLGQHFGEESPAGAGEPFPSESLGAAIDGSGDGLIGLGDITPIGQHFDALVEGYHVYCSAEVSDCPAEPDQPNGPTAGLLAEVALSAGDSTAGRLVFSHAIDMADVDLYYWVRPYHGAVDGAASNVVEPLVANLPPIAILAPTRPGAWRR